MKIQKLSKKHLPSKIKQKKQFTVEKNKKPPSCPPRKLFTDFTSDRFAFFSKWINAANTVFSEKIKKSKKGKNSYPKRKCSKKKKIVCF